MTETSETLKKPKIAMQPAILAVLLLILFLGTALRLWGLGDKSLRGDEIALALRIRKGLISILLNQYNSLTYVVNYFFSFLANGSREFILRFSSFLEGVLGIAAIYRIGKLWHGEKEGLISAFLLGISYTHIFYSQDARFYALMVLLSLLSLLSIWRALETNRAAYWLCFVLFSLLNLYNQSLSLFVLGCEACFAGGVILYKFAAATSVASSHQEREPPPPTYRVPLGEAQSQAKRLLLSLVVIACLYLPRLGLTASLLESTREFRMAGSSVEEEFRFVPVILDVFRQLLAVRNLALALFAILFLCGLLSNLTHQRRIGIALLTLLWITVPFLIYLILSWKTLGFTSRYLIFLLPVLYITVARGVCVIADTLGWISRERLGWPDLWVRGAVTGLSLVLFAIISSRSLRYYYPREKQNWRDTAAFLQKAVAASEAVVASSAYRLDCLLYYGMSQERLFVSEGLPAFRELAAQYQGVWFVGAVSPREPYDREIDRWLREQEAFQLTFQGVWSDIRVAYEAKGDLTPGQQVALLQSAVALTPRDHLLRLDLGDAYRAAGRKVEAIAEYRYALQLDPENARARSRLKELP